MYENYKRKYDFLETKRIINSLSPALGIIQRYDSITNINTQLVDSIYPILEASYRWNEIIKPIKLNSVIESITRMNELISNSLAISNMNINNITGLTSVLGSISNLYRTVDFDALSALKAFQFNIPKLEIEVLNNLEILKEFDWSSLDEENLEVKEIEYSLNEIVVDLNDNLNWQQKILIPLLKFKNENPIIYLFIVLFIFNPINTAVSDGVLSLVKDTTKPIVQEIKIKNYNYMEKNIKIEVNSVVNMYIESDDIKKTLLKNIRYVSTNKLIVRESKKVKSRKIHILEFGQVVRVLIKNKNWTFIEYKSEELGDEIIQGWVFTRYLSKFE